MINKKAQEEMIGFAIIAVIVSVIVLILLSFIIKSPNKNAVESYQVESFIKSSLQYTSDCEDEYGFPRLQELIINCRSRETCIDGRESCAVLESTLNGLISSGWNIEEGSAVKGYSLKITVEEEEELAIEEGEKTSTFKGGFQDFSKSGKNYEISLNIYS
jgi:hypothetical protein